MRILPLLVLSITASSSLVLAQSPGDNAAQQAAQAAQQAAQAAIQANQQAMQQAQRANEEAMRQSQEATQRAMQQSQQALNNSAYIIPFSATPAISKKSGNYSAPFTVRLKSATRGSTIYYTTDGWTPTISSARYTGPITIDSSTHLQAISIAPSFQRSMVASAQYIFPGQPFTNAVPAAPLPTPAQDPSGKCILPADTPIRLVFAEDVNEKKAEIGDKVPLILADDFVAGDFVFAKKGTPVDSVVSESDGPHIAGVPGLLSFEVRSFQAGGITVHLRGAATKEGQAKPPNAAVLIPGVDFFMIFRHGTNANIKKGTPFTAYLAQDTPLAPLN